MASPLVLLLTLAVGPHASEPPEPARGPSILSGELVRSDQLAWGETGGEATSGGAWFLALSAGRDWGTRSVLVRVQANEGAGVGPRPGGCSWAAFASDAAAVALQEAVVAGAALDGRLRLAAGLLDPTTEFDTNAVANSETEQFLSCSLVNSAVIDFPAPSPGLAMGFDLRGWARAAATILTDGNDRRGGFAMLELQGVRSAGTVRAYAWSRRAPDGRTSSGAGCSMDHRAGPAIVLFARAALRAAPGSGAETALSAGAEFDAGFLFPASVVGIAVEETARPVVPGARGAHRDRHAELNVRFELAPGLSVSPDLQWAREMDGAGRIRDVLVAGLRTRVAF